MPGEPEPGEEKGARRESPHRARKKTDMDKKERFA
jgi:hypothetical protein